MNIFAALKRRLASSTKPFYLGWSWDLPTVSKKNEIVKLACLSEGGSMDNLKVWLVEVGVKKMGPSAIRGAILGLFGWLMTKEGLLASFGIVSDATAHTT